MNRKVGGVMYDDETGKAFIMIQRSFMTACKRDEIRYFYFYDLRHTFANQLVINGIELRTVKVLLSRKTLTATNPTENMFSAVRD